MYVIIKRILSENISVYPTVVQYSLGCKYLFPLHVWGVLQSVKFTKLISSGAKLSALGYGADTADTAPGKVNMQCGGEGGDVDKVYVIKILKLKVINVHYGLSRRF